MTTTTTQPKAKPKAKRKRVGASSAGAATSSAPRSSGVSAALIDPLLYSTSIPSSFTVLDDAFSYHAQEGNQREVYEVFICCRSAFLMFIDRGYQPSTPFGRRMSQILHEHVWMGDPAQHLAIWYQETLTYWLSLMTDGDTTPCTLIVMVIRYLQEETWYAKRPRTDQPQPPAPGVRWIFLLARSVGVSDARYLIDFCVRHPTTRHFLVVYRGKLTGDSLMELDAFAQKPDREIRIEHCLWVDLLLHPYDYPYVPTLRRVTPTEKDKYLREHKLKFEKLAGLSIYDRMVRYHDFAVGDAVCVTTRDDSGHLSQLHRVVLERKAILQSLPETTHLKHGLPSGDTTDKTHTLQPLMIKPIHVLPANAKQLTQQQKG